MAIMTASYDANAFSFAEYSYQFMNGSCPKSQSDDPQISGKNQKTEAVAAKSEDCDVCRQLTQTERLKKDVGIQSEDAYLSSLAQERSHALTCQNNQISFLLGNQKEKDIFLEDYSSKLILLGYIKKKMATLLPAVGSDDQKSAMEYKRIRLAGEAILASMPYAQIGPMRDMINNITSQSDMFNQNGIQDFFRKSLFRAVEQALVAAKTKIIAEKKIMDDGSRSLGRTLSDSSRESLAQDTELIESFRNNHSDVVDDLRPVACRIDAKYGRGAKYRDNAILVATVLGGGVASVALRAGAMALETAATGAAATGLVSNRAATILRILAVATESAAPLDQAYHSCQSETVSGESHTSSLSCSQSVVKSLKGDNCFLSVALATLGTRVSFKISQKVVNSKREVEIVEQLGSVSESNAVKSPTAITKAVTEIEKNKIEIGSQFKMYLKQIVKGFTYDFNEAGKISLYPIIGPIKVTKEAIKILNAEGIKEVWRAPFRVASKDGGYIIASATIAYVNGKIKILQTDFDQETKEFRSEIGKKPYIFVDMVPRDNQLSGVPEYDYNSTALNLPKTQFIRADSYDDLLTKLAEIRKKSGPIYGLSIFNHGLPGEIGDINKEVLKNHENVKDLFMPNGKILLNSCLVGKGEKGAEFTKLLGSQLLDKGGKVYSSAVPIDSDLFKTTLSSFGVPDSIGKGLDGLLNFTSPQALEFSLLIDALNGGVDLSAKKTRETNISPRENSQ